MHGTPLDYTRAEIQSPKQARAAGERDGFAKLGEAYRLVFIPESPPMNERVPNGLVLVINLVTKECRLSRMR
jgi:hypothetical protein